MACTLVVVAGKFIKVKYELSLLSSDSVLLKGSESSRSLQIQHKGAVSVGYMLLFVPPNEHIMEDDAGMKR